MSDPSASQPPSATPWARGRTAVWWLLWLAIALLSARPLYALVHAFVARWGYPLDLEWMEGGQLVHAQRLLAGEAIYVPCDHGFIPFPYPPGHFTALALVGWVTEVSFNSGRALSIAALLTCMVVLGRAVWRAAPTRLFAEVAVVLSVASIASAYPVVDGWYDLVRVDCLFAALVLCAVAVTCGMGADRRRNLWLAIVVGLLLTAAVFTKQTAIVYAPWLVLVALLRDRRAAAVVTLVAFGSSAALLAWLQLVSDGWYWTEIFRVMSGHVLVAHLAKRATLLFLSWAPWVPLVPLLALAAWRLRWLRRDTAIWVGTLLLAAAQSIASASKVAAHVNNLMTVVLLTVPVTLILGADVWRGLESPRWRRVVGVLALGLCGWQVWLWPADFSRYEPTAADREAAAALNRLVAALPGDVIAPSHPFLPVQTGHGLDQPATQAVHDHGSLRPEELDLFACTTSTEAEWAIMNTAPTPHLRGFLLSRFEFHERLRDTPFTRSGYITRAHELLRRRAEPQRLRQRVLFDFEHDDLEGWVRRGDAFEGGLLPRSRWIYGTRGKMFLSSLHPRLGDAAVGSIISPPFTIDRDQLTMLVGGGGAGIQVELRVIGGGTRRAHGVEAPVLIPWTFDVRPWKGRRARLVLVDRALGGWGHVHLDEVVLFDVASPSL